jgi:hypothetical protein
MTQVAEADLRRNCHRLQHDPSECALAEFAEEQAGEKRPLLRTRLREQQTERLGPQRTHACTAQGREIRHRAIDLGK